MPITARTGAQRRDDIVQFITDFWTVNKYAPTVREIARGVGLSHPSSAHHHLVQLERAGLVRSTPGAMRSIRVVER